VHRPRTSHLRFHSRFKFRRAKQKQDPDTPCTVAERGGGAEEQLKALSKTSPSFEEKRERRERDMEGEAEHRKTRAAGSEVSDQRIEIVLSWLTL